MAGALWVAATGGTGPDGIPHAALAAASGICLYWAGLVMNDLADFVEDMRERPERPLPEGRISQGAALGGAMVFLVAGLSFAFAAHALMNGLLLAALILLYNGGLKQNAWSGALAMGGCRAAHVLLGASAMAAGADCWGGETGMAAGGAAAIIGGYIAVVTALARHEATPGSRITPQRIGLLLGLLIPLQAGIGVCAFGCWPWNLVALLLLGLIPLHRYGAKFFSPS